MNIMHITKDDMKNGDGVRTVLWVSGCSHHCHNCHNPESWDHNFGHKFTDADMKIIDEQLNEDYIDGITLSGGDPLNEHNYQDITELCKTLKENHPDKTIWLYSGYVYDNIKDWEIFKYIDVFIDGKFEESLKPITPPKYRGSTNQRVIDIQKTREQSTDNELVIILYCD